ncbi:MAG: hypothetical protein ABIK12_13210 [Pseudomonadota bacterium]
MRSLLTCALVLGLLVMLGACRASYDRMPTRGSAPLNPGSSIMSADARCGDVVKAVREKLRRSSFFGSASETSTLDGAQFVLPWKRDGDVRRQATVTVTCYDQDKRTARITVDVDAECRKKNGSWESCSKTGNLERQVLDELYPLP